MKKIRFLNRSKIGILPKEVGVYLFKKGKEFLYIGKALNLRERVKNHFQKPNYWDSLFINRVLRIGYLKTDSEIEALILEANLIKKYQPKYNTVWKDDKNYFYVAITRENLPRVFITHQPQNLKPETRNLKPKYIGPFVEGTSLKRSLTYLRKVFPYYTSKKHPKGSCLWCSLKLCPGPCPNKKEYQKNIKNLIAVLKGKSNKVLENLKKEMEKASVFQDYEKAAKIRDQIENLRKVISHSRVFEPTLPFKKELPPDWQFERAEAYDISNIQGKEATGSMVVFIKGQPAKSLYRKFKIRIQKKPNDIAMLKEVLERRLKHSEWPLPDLILIDGGKAQLNIAIKIKNEKLKMKNYNSKFKIMSLAKRKNELFIEGRQKPVLLKSLPRQVFNFILQLRDEAHRFAISYHKKLREKTLLSI